MLAGGMVVFGVHKMSAGQAKQVEEHTGVPPEELEDEDLEAAMAELNIPKQELTDEDREQELAPTSRGSPAFRIRRSPEHRRPRPPPGRGLRVSAALLP